MQKIEILVVGTNKPIMETIARLIDKDGLWKATICLSFKDAYEICLNKEFKLILIGAGLTEEEELEIKTKLNELYPSLPIVEHYGGGSGLLFAEIHQALA